MFKSISWQEYFYATTIVVGGYYAVSILLLYSKGLIQKFKANRATPTRVENENSGGLSNNLMGKIRRDQPIEKVSTHHKTVQAEEISVAIEEPKKSETQISSDVLLVGSVSDLLQEIKTLSNIISDTKGSKEDGASMFQSLLENYSHLSSTNYQEGINLFLYDQCKSQCAFEIELAEIKTWWPSESQIIKL